jgi:hypothetical protein
MTPERMARLIALWVRLYTRKLPAPIAQRRIDEIDADLHDHIAHERGRGRNDRRIGLALVSRMVRGIAADAAWRGQTIAAHPPPKERKKMNRPGIRVAVVTGFVLLVPLIGTLITNGTNWGVFDFVFAGALIAGTGLLLELAAKKTGNVLYLVAAIAVAVAAIVLGEADDAPGLVLFGCLVIAGTIALAVRTAQRSG